MKFILIVILTLVIALTGCTSSMAVIEPAIYKCVDERAVKDTLAVYPPKVKVGNIGAGGHVDGVTLFIENGYDDSVIVNISLTCKEHVTNDADTGLEYYPAPDNYQRYVRIKEGKIEITAHSICSVPIELTMPKDVSKFPERWEFDVQVARGQGFVSTALIQRWLITMR